jgi:glutamyl-tRNA reductase
MKLFAFGINHQTAPLKVREQVAFQPETLSRALRDLVEHRSVKEAAILSTCNRTEVYCNTPQPAQAVTWLADYHGLKSRELEPYLYRLPREQAIKHAFRVAAGLDSMVLGEPQILGQVKQAVRLAEQAGTLGTLLNRLFQRSFSIAKAVRSQTEIGAHSVSMAAAAVRLAERIFPTIKEQSVLLVGAGEMIELCAIHFATRSPTQITVANRTLERAEELAQRVNAKAITLNELPQQLAAHDIVVTSTAASLPIIGKGLVERAIRVRKHRPLFMVDLAVPRDIEAEVAQLDDVFLYTVDELAITVQDGAANRQNAVMEAEAIIASGVSEFVRWLENRSAVPTIRALRDSIERSRRHELERALKRLQAGEDPHVLIEGLSRALSNKFLHIPTEALTRADAETRKEMLALLEQLYRVQRGEP